MGAIKEDLWPGQYYTNELLQTKALLREDGEVVLDEKTTEDLEIFCRDSEAESHSDAEAARKTRLMPSHKGTSLAALIAGTSASDFLPGEDDIENRSLSTTPPSIITSKQMHASKSPSTPTKTRSSSSAGSSPDNDTSPEITRVSPVAPHRHGLSFAALIAAADLSESEGGSDTASDPSDDHSPLLEYKYVDTPRPEDSRYCYDPIFRGRSPCDTREQLAYGKSAKAAIKLLRRRFAADHDATGDGSWYREWIVWKGESGNPSGALMHGGSMLRYEIMSDKDEKLENEERYDASGFLYDLESEDDVVLVSRCRCVSGCFSLIDFSRSPAAPSITLSECMFLSSRKPPIAFSVISLTLPTRRMIWSLRYTTSIQHFFTMLTTHRRRTLNFTTATLIRRIYPHLHPQLELYTSATHP